MVGNWEVVTFVVNRKENAIWWGRVVMVRGLELFIGMEPINLVGRKKGLKNLIVGLWGCGGCGAEGGKVAFSPTPPHPGHQSTSSCPNGENLFPPEDNQLSGKLGNS